MNLNRYEVPYVVQRVFIIAETKFEKYRIVQDWLFESEFDWVVKNLERKDKESEE